MSVPESRAGDRARGATGRPSVAFPPESRTQAIQAARAAASKQADDVVILDVRELITITDYFVICSGTTERQAKSIAEDVIRQLKEAGSRPLRREGEVGSRWVLLDYADFVVHVFEREEREFYRLENLWIDAPRVEWQHEEGDGSRSEA